MKLEIPKSLIDNIDVVINYQNTQLIRAICEWKNWNSEALIEEFINSKPNKPLKIKPSNLRVYNTNCQINTNKKKIIKRKKNTLDTLDISIPIYNSEESASNISTNNESSNNDPSNNESSNNKSSNNEST